MPIYIANRENQRNKIYKLLFIYLRGKKYSKMKKRVIEQMSIVEKENCSWPTVSRCVYEISVTPS
jgi:hypothetical protein